MFQFKAGISCEELLCKYVIQKITQRKGSQITEFEFNIIKNEVAYELKQKPLDEKTLEEVCLDVNSSNNWGSGKKFTYANDTATANYNLRNEYHSANVYDRGIVNDVFKKIIDWCPVQVDVYDSVPNISPEKMALAEKLAEFIVFKSFNKYIKGLSRASKWPAQCDAKTAIFDYDLASTINLMTHDGEQLECTRENVISLYNYARNVAIKLVSETENLEISNVSELCLAYSHFVKFFTPCPSLMSPYIYMSSGNNFERDTTGYHLLVQNNKIHGTWYDSYNKRKMSDDDFVTGYEDVIKGFKK